MNNYIIIDVDSLSADGGRDCNVCMKMRRENYGRKP
jgi:hypothetical protein